MIYTHFIGRVGKDAKIINGKNGDFLSMDVTVSDYFKGQETTTWIRVRSNKARQLTEVAHQRKNATRGGSARTTCHLG